MSCFILKYPTILIDSGRKDHNEDTLFIQDLRRKLTIEKNTHDPNDFT